MTVGQSLQIRPLHGVGTASGRGARYAEELRSCHTAPGAVGRPLEPLDNRAENVVEKGNHP